MYKQKLTLTLTLYPCCQFRFWNICLCVCACFCLWLFCESAAIDVFGQLFSITYHAAINMQQHTSATPLTVEWIKGSSTPSWAKWCENVVIHSLFLAFSIRRGSVKLILPVPLPFDRNLVNKVKCLRTSWALFLIEKQFFFKNLVNCWLHREIWHRRHFGFGSKSFKSEMGFSSVVKAFTSLAPLVNH